MKLPIPKSLLLGALFLFLGCAGSREETAFKEIAEIERQVYSGAVDVQPDSLLPVLNENASLETYLAYAALNNPQLKAAFNNWKAALAQVPQARALPDPRFNYSYYIREVETRVGPQRQAFGISQQFPWFGKLQLKGDVALESANAARQRYEAAKLQLFYQVKSAYYEYCYLDRAILVVNENIQLIKSLEAVILAKYRAGTTPYSDLVQVQVEIDKLQDQQKSLTDLIRPVKARLNAVMNRPLNMPLSPAVKLAADSVNISDERLSEFLKDNNPALKESDFLAEREKDAIGLAKKSYYPDIMLGVDYIDTGEALSPATPESGKDPLIARLSLNLPIWFGKNRASVKQAEARYLSAIQRRQNKENQLLLNLETTLYQFREAQRKIRLYQDILLPRAREALNVAQSAFRVDNIGYLDLINAQRTLLEFELTLERSLANHAQRLAEIEMLVGRELPKKNEK